MSLGKVVKFADLDSKGKHKDTLTKIQERGISREDLFNEEWEGRQSYAEELLTLYHTQAMEYLKSKGFDDTSGLFCVLNGEVVRWRKETGKLITDATSLFGAIQERDALLGQTGDYLAALIDHNCKMLLTKWPPTPDQFKGVLDTAMLVQNHFFYFYQREKLHFNFSIGAACNTAASAAHGRIGIIERNAELVLVKAEAIRLYQSKPKLHKLSPKNIVTRIHPELLEFIKNNKMKKKDYTPPIIANWIRELIPRRKYTSRGARQKK
jgi:hypothetical protein